MKTEKQSRIMEMKEWIKEQIGRASCKGKSVDLGGRRIIKKKKTTKKNKKKKKKKKKKQRK